MLNSVSFPDILNCSSCNSDLTLKGFNIFVCSSCDQKWVMKSGVFTLESKLHYSDSFGLQWNKFEKTQLDSYQMQGRSEQRLLEETGWEPESIKNKLILDAGCGAGRFSEIVLKFGGRVVSIDASSAVFSARRNLAFANSLVIQSDLVCTPLKDASFELIFCIGVLQHTELPKDIVRELLRLLAPNGEIVFTFYENKGWRTRLYSKYLVRPLTRRVAPDRLLRLVEKTSLIWFPVTHKLFSLPLGIGRLFSYLIPIANYVGNTYWSKSHAREEAILDTFDMLSPRFDRPIKKSQLRDWVRDSGYTVSELPVSPKFGTLKFKKVI